MSGLLCLWATEFLPLMSEFSLGKFAAAHDLSAGNFLYLFCFSCTVELLLSLFSCLSSIFDDLSSL